MKNLSKIDMFSNLHKMSDSIVEQFPMLTYDKFLLLNSWFQKLKIELMIEQ
jgi:hypothetical protein